MVNREQLFNTWRFVGRWKRGWTSRDDVDDAGRRPSVARALSLEVTRSHCASAARLQRTLAVMRRCASMLREASAIANQNGGGASGTDRRVSGEKRATRCSNASAGASPPCRANTMACWTSKQRIVGAGGDEQRARPASANRKSREALDEAQRERT
jgi:hypothetical protein